nr:MAG TPA: hypothetical protein [Caudoviricetes sp.]
MTLQQYKKDGIFQPSLTLLIHCCIIIIHVTISNIVNICIITTCIHICSCSSCCRSFKLAFVPKETYRHTTYNTCETNHNHQKHFPKLFNQFFLALSSIKKN